MNIFEVITSPFKSFYEFLTKPFKPPEKPPAKPPPIQPKPATPSIPPFLEAQITKPPSLVPTIPTQSTISSVPDLTKLQQTIPMTFATARPPPTRTSEDVKKTIETATSLAGEAIKEGGKGGVVQTGKIMTKEELEKEGIKPWEKAVPISYRTIGEYEVEALKSD